MGARHRLTVRCSRWGLGAGLVFAAVSAQAAFLRNVPQVLRQPDGTVLNLLVTGDEYYNRLHDANDFTVVRDRDTGVLVYAIKVDGRLQPTAFVVGRDDPAAAGLEPGLMPDPRTLPGPDELYPMERRHARARAMGMTTAPAFTAINNLVIFIRFADETNGGFNGADTYQMWFDSGSSSLRTYFLEASYGVLTIGSTFYPAPSGSAVVSFQDAHNRSYYKPYDATSNPDGYQDSQRNDREWTLMQAAATAVAPLVPASLNLDANNDGFIDSVVFVVSGTAVSADWSNLLWPHRWVIDSSHYPATINGKHLGDYDLQLDGNMGVGVACHEMTHTLGAPDLYHYRDCDNPNSLVPVGRWDLMAEDRDPPQHTTAYLKWRYLGFIPTIPAITSSGDYTLNPLTSPGGNCYKIASPNSPTEYFVLEYRKRSFPFENSVPGSGLLVTRIDTAADGQGNRCGPPDEVYVYRPGGTTTADGEINHANFAADAVPPRTAIADTTDPSSFLTGGTPGGLSISNIGTAGATISFHVAIQAPCVPASFGLASPANGANLPGLTSATLNWAPASGATSYDVYFGTAVNNLPLLGNQTATSVQVTVADGATYFWRVAARNPCGLTLAPASGSWAFSVGGSGGITLLSDDFEGGLSKWRILRSQNAAATDWGIVGCKTASGHGAAWCAAGGTLPQPACTQYAPNQGTFLAAGPFDLSDAVDGAWDFDIWTDIDDGGVPSNPPDKVWWVWSLDGSHYYGYLTAGTTNGWEHVSVKMSAMHMADNTPVLGQPKVYFAFIFTSDAATQKEGAYLDNVVIRKSIAVQSSFSHWLPAVIHKDVPSRNAWWRSDVAVLNRSSQPANLTLTIHAPSGPKTMTTQLAGNAQTLLRDVAEQMGIAADSGALEVVSDQDVFLTGRTYSQVDPTHTYGQDYDGANPGSLLAAGQSAWLPQLTQNADYRTNIGITNTGTATANVAVTLYNAAGSQVWTDTRDYAAGAFFQHDQPFLGGGGTDSGYAKVTVNSGSGVVAYASVIDQATGDPTTINMKSGSTIGSAPFSHWIPAVIHKDVPSRNAWWRSDVAILNRSSQTATVTLRVHAPSGQAQAGPFALAANGQLVLKDVAGVMGIAADSGPLEVTSDQDVFLTGRTYSQVDATHTYGQDYDGAEPASLLAAGQSAWLPQLTQNAYYRTNIGITNAGTSTANVTVTLYDANGNPTGWSDTRDYAPGAFFQHDQPFAAGGGIDSGYAKVTVNSGSGVVAYASVIDQATGDPTTINMKR